MTDDIILLIATVSSLVIGSIVYRIMANSQSKMIDEYRDRVWHNERYWEERDRKRRVMEGK
jgi:hypothetical protein